jgi:hypothetical protein
VDREVVAYSLNRRVSIACSRAHLGLFLNRWSTIPTEDWDCGFTETGGIVLADYRGGHIIGVGGTEERGWGREDLTAG